MILYLDALFSDYRWYRRWRGGRWEHWWVDTPINSFIWLQISGSGWPDERPGLCRGTPIIEDWE